MLGGSAMPRVWNSLPAQPVVGVRKNQALAVLRDLDLLEAIQIAPDLVSLGLEAAVGAAVGELFLEHQGEDGTEHVAADKKVSGQKGISDCLDNKVSRNFSAHEDQAAGKHRIRASGHGRITAFTSTNSEHA